MAVETLRDAVETTWQVPMSIARVERALSINEGPRSQLEIVSSKVTTSRPSSPLKSSAIYKPINYNLSIRPPSQRNG